ncbi:sulfotransferase family protein [Leptothoe kymatousa]|uniref:Sulfotransferase n=1 Tax=Leptothoe kymatousa TAU-MAC 1615 TaxID=2364775 RepID=A0ABS5Y3Q6_9CYAN|nr:sulfotransferase [Leptothoe kymatousa]MBT9312468.1 sulfotransferase [Leptothoe kymatousa TAU-MAC 1615]
MSNVENRFPNFFLVGAPKCGTSAMSEYLRSHPDIFMCQPKEPHFFSTDFSKIRCVRTQKQYLALFKGSEIERIRGEASASYLYSSKAIKNLYEFNPQAKLLVMLRNPVDMVYSLHSEFLFNGYETEKDFEKAWSLQEQRRTGSFIPRTCLEPSFLQYRDHANYAEQLTRLFSYFPREQVKTIIFDDFIKDTRSVYQQVLSFLDIPSDNRTSFPKVNARKQARAHWLDTPLQLIRPYKRIWYPWIRTLKSLVKIEKRSITSNINLARVQTTDRQIIAPELRRELESVFSSDISQLSQIINQDLDCWLTIYRNQKKTF